MAREEAIKFYADEILLLKLAPTINGESNMEAEWKRQIEIHEMAISALREQEKLESIGWISVEERMPDKWREGNGDMINYMVFMPEYGVDIGNYAKPAKTWVCMGIPCKVTHWMPLPEPPEVEG